MLVLSSVILHLLCFRISLPLGTVCAIEEEHVNALHGGPGPARGCLSQGAGPPLGWQGPSRGLVHSEVHTTHPQGATGDSLELTNKVRGNSLALESLSGSEWKGSKFVFISTAKTKPPAPRCHC